MAWAVFGKPRWTVSTVLAALLALTVAALVVTRNPTATLPLAHRQQQKPSPLPAVDESPLNSAEALAASATTPDEQVLSEEAVRLGDQIVDLNFAAALAAAAEQPAKVTPETIALQSRVKEAQAKVNADQEEAAALAKQIAAARPGAVAALQDRMELAKAQLELDQDELGDAQRDLARAGSNTEASLEQLLAEHEKSTAHLPNAQPAAGAPTAASAIAAASPVPHSLVARWQAWGKIQAEQQSIEQALAASQARLAALTAQHNAIEETIAATRTIASGPARTGASAKANRAESIRQLGQQQHLLADYDGRIEAERELGDVYRRWGAAAQSVRQVAAHRLTRSLLWLLLLLLLTLAADHLISRLFLKIRLDLKRLLSIRSVLHFVTRSLGTIAILMLIFGTPSQLATVLALAGAGLTVALKDFIVAFFGWFVLMGRHGMRPGDWVEINGVQGKVIQVGLLHTVILETGNWTGAGHPTGRKVAVVNSFPIEGHYFNFTTAGQWLWDEVQVGLPARVNPIPVVQALQELVTKETAATANLAEQEWKRAVTTAGLQSFSAKPAVGVRPTDTGLTIVIRYMTRADDREELRSKLYRAVFDLLLANGVVPRAAEGAPEPS